MEELRKMSADELNNELVGLSKQLFDYRVQHAGGYLNKPHVLRITKRDIARVKTIMHEQKQQPDTAADEAADEAADDGAST